jgi:hypothetical protein
VPLPNLALLEGEMHSMVLQPLHQLLMCASRSAVAMTGDMTGSNQTLCPAEEQRRDGVR